MRNYFVAVIASPTFRPRVMDCTIMFGAGRSSVKYQSSSIATVLLIQASQYDW